MTQDNEQADEKELHRQNVTVLVFVAVLAMLGIWLVNAFMAHKKLEECFESGRRNCMLIDMNDPPK